MNDPLAGMRLTSPFFAHLTTAIAKVADEHCAGRVVAVTEGGYDLVALAESLRATIGALEGRAAGAGAPSGAAPRGEATVKAVIPQLTDRWKL
jgi:acetoin utilization deacetylase AcuC-like enzyme